MGDFHINWKLSKEEWRKAQALEQTNDVGYTVGEIPMFDLLYGEVQFTYAGENLFPAEHIQDIMERQREGNIQRGGPTWPISDAIEQNTGITLSLVDLAVQLALIQDSQFVDAPEGAIATFQGSDDNRNICFRKSDSAVLITSNVYSDRYERPQLSVPCVKFEVGIRRFLIAFTDEVAMYSPAILGWKVFSKLRDYQ